MVTQVDWLIEMVRDLEKRVVVLEHDRRMEGYQCSYDVSGVEVDESCRCVGVRYGSEQKGEDHGGTDAGEV